MLGDNLIIFRASGPKFQVEFPVSDQQPKDATDGNEGRNQAGVADQCARDHRLIGAETFDDEPPHARAHHPDRKRRTGFELFRVFPYQPEE